MVQSNKIVHDQYIYNTLIKKMSRRKQNYCCLTRFVEETNENECTCLLNCSLCCEGPEPCPECTWKLVSVLTLLLLSADEQKGTCVNSLSPVEPLWFLPLVPKISLCSAMTSVNQKEPSWGPTIQLAEEMQSIISFLPCFNSCDLKPM